MSPHDSKKPAPRAAPKHAWGEEPPPPQTLETTTGVRVIVRHQPEPKPEPQRDPAWDHPRVVIMPANQSAADREAFMRYLYKDHGEFIEETLTRRWNVSPESAKDLRQQVMLVVLKYHDKKEPIGNMRGFLQGVMWNEVQNRGRRVKPLFLPDGDADTAISPALDPERAVALAEKRAKIRRYIRQLPQAEAEVLQAVDLLEMTLGEAAAAFGRPLGTISTELTRAREMLKDVARASERATIPGARRRP